MSTDQEIQRHYTRGDLAGVILEALRAAGKDVDRLMIEDLAPVDEFHVRGRAATAELALGLGRGCACSTWAAGSAIASSDIAK